MSSLIPDGIIDDFPLVGSKAKEVLTGVRTSDNGGSWASFTPTTDYINNKVTLTNEPAGNVVIVSSIDYNTPVTQIEPTKVTRVLKEVYASNSHDVLKACLITTEATDIIPVGNGTKPLEQKVLEEVILDNIGNIQTTPTHTLNSLDGDSSASKWFLCEVEFADGGKGIGVYSQEMIYNATDLDYGDDTGDFGQLTNGTDTDLLGQTIKTKVLGARL